MSLPPEIDKKIRDRFVELEKLAKNLIKVEYPPKSDGAGGFYVAVLPANYKSNFERLKINLGNLINYLSLSSNRSKSLFEKIERESSISGASELLGIIMGIKNDYEAGFLGELSDLIESNVVADYMAQANQLLGEGIGQYDYVPAAVLAGAVLEDALRRLCQRRNPPIDLLKPNGDYKTMGSLIEDLKRVATYNELVAKQLRAWADIRNAAAHGKFEEFDRSQVERMIAGIQDFLAKYL